MIDAMLPPSDRSITDTKLHLSAAAANNVIVIDDDMTCMNACLSFSLSSEEVTSALSFVSMYAYVCAVHHNLLKKSVRLCESCWIGIDQLKSLEKCSFRIAAATPT